MQANKTVNRSPCDAVGRYRQPQATRFPHGPARRLWTAVAQVGGTVPHSQTVRPHLPVAKRQNHAGPCLLILRRRFFPYTSHAARSLGLVSLICPI